MQDVLHWAAAEAALFNQVRPEMSDVRHGAEEPGAGRAWILLCLALALHVFDEARTGFLDVYNPTVLAMRERLGWWPMPTFSFGVWLAGLIGASSS